MVRITSSFLSCFVLVDMDIVPRTFLDRMVRTVTKIEVNLVAAQQQHPETQHAALYADIHSKTGRPMPRVSGTRRRQITTVGPVKTTRVLNSVRDRWRSLMLLG